jgi:hypothetical protein
MRCEIDEVQLKKPDGTERKTKENYMRMDRAPFGTVTEWIGAAVQSP